MSVHLMNMEADGEAILVTFVRNGSVARAFDPCVNGQPARFTATGAGRMTDSATGSTWDAITGECLWGAMKGRCLTARSGQAPYCRPRVPLSG